MGMNFRRPSVFYLNTDYSNPSFQFVNHIRVHHETDKRFWDNRPPNFTQNFIFQYRKFTSHFQFSHFRIRKLHKQMLWCEKLILRNNFKKLPQKTFLIVLWSFHRKYFFHWLCWDWSWLHSNQSCSTVHTLVKKFLPTTEWQSSKNIYYPCFAGLII